ncbi:MAG: ribonuclease E/G, partial [Actinomycetota bacterium]
MTIRKPSAPDAKSKSERRSGTATATKKKSQRSRKPKQSRSQQSHRTATQRRRPPVEIIEPPETARKQMLVRTSPSQTQIVVLEGPVLVEHYVAHSDRKSLVGNVYVGRVRNVLPGMEAAFIDFGEGKNGVLYA